MSMKTVNQEQEEITPSSLLTVAETLRAASATSATKGDNKEEEKMSLFWRVFGGTILSITALVVITLYNNISSSINDLRAELSREREARTGFMKKEDADNRSKLTFERIHALEGYKADIEALRERTSTNSLCFESLKKDVGGSIETLRRDVAGIDLLKERVVAVESLRKDVSGIDVLKERVATLSVELKAAKEETIRIQHELEKNRSADIERKVLNDSQIRQYEETLKDLQKSLQNFREKLARFEGSQPAKVNLATQTTGPTKKDGQSCDEE